MKIIIFYQVLSDKSVSQTVGELYYERRPVESDQSKKILNKCFTIMFSFKKCNKPDCGKFLCKATIEMLTCVHKCLMGWNSIILNPLWHKKRKWKVKFWNQPFVMLFEEDRNEQRERKQQNQDSSKICYQKLLGRFQMLDGELTIAKGS